jgi:hypothetical protein
MQSLTETVCPMEFHHYQLDCYRDYYNLIGFYKKIIYENNKVSFLNVFIDDMLLR